MLMYMLTLHALNEVSVVNIQPYLIDQLLRGGQGVYDPLRLLQASKRRNRNRVLG